jgi:hypothetical protein
MTTTSSSRPLIISDCDEVLLYMVSPFRTWLAKTQGVIFSMNGNDFANALRYEASNELVDMRDVWRLLNLFFDTEMPSQTPIPGAVEAINQLASHAEIVVLTNLQDHRAETRKAQLAAHGIDVRVFTNQGPKGPAIRAILNEYQPSKAIFIDDLAQHIQSAAEITPEVTRLHLCGEPLLSPHIVCAHTSGHAAARIDNWPTALPWLLTQL